MTVAVGALSLCCVRQDPGHRGARRQEDQPEDAMSDDKSKRGRPDQDRVASTENYEVDRLAKKFELPAPLVKKVVVQEGPMRRDVEKYLEKMKKK